MSVRSSIATALAARLATITNGNGYLTDVLTVYHDDIPLGMEIDDHELPAIFQIALEDEQNREKQCVRNVWAFELQLWDISTKTDSNMDNFVNDVYRAIFAGTATGTRLAAFRDLHPSVYDVQPLKIIPDLNMIETNRVYCIFLEVYYESSLLDV